MLDRGITMSNDLMNRNNDWMDFGNGFPFDQFTNHFFGNHFGFPNLIDKQMMKTDVAETDKAYTVTIDLPGLKKENIQIDYTDGVLSVGGKQEHESESRDDKGDVIHSERYYGTYSRQYNLSNVDGNAITAKYDGGVLTLDLPKLSKKASGRKIEIQ